MDMPVVVRAANLAGVGLELPEWLHWQVRLVLGPLPCLFVELTAAHPATQKEAAGCSGLPWSLKNGMHPLLPGQD